MRKFENRKGVSKIHLFNEIWRIGSYKYVDRKKLHSVIYSPEDKEYDVWDEDVKFFYPKWGIRTHTKPDPARVKIYILTFILDERKNWSFDMNSKPEPGNVKVVFENGKIAWTTFTGKWKDSFEKIETPRYITKNGVYVESDINTSPFITYRKIVAWKIKN